jgi:hypothetical protein
MIYATNTIHGAKGRIDRLSMSSSKACCPSWLQPLWPLVVLTCQNVVFTCQDVVLTCQDLQWCTNLIAQKMAALSACRIQLKACAPRIERATRHADSSRYGRDRDWFPNLQSLLGFLAQRATWAALHSRVGQCRGFIP